MKVSRSDGRRSAWTRLSHSLCRLNGWDGELTLDPAEVQAWRWMNLEDVYTDIKENPDRYTSWIKAELSVLKALLLPQVKETPSLHTS